MRKLKTGDNKIKMYNRFELTGDGKCSSQIKKNIEITKDDSKSYVYYNCLFKGPLNFISIVHVIRSFEF